MKTRIYEMVYSLSNLSNANVFLFDNDDNLISKHIINKASCKNLSEFKTIKKDVTSTISDYKGYATNYNIKGSFVSIYPILRNENKFAFLYVVANMELDKLAQSAIEYGVSIISMKLERDRTAKLAQTRFNKTLVDIMLNNKELPDEFYENVENDLGWDSEGCVVGICIRLHVPYEQNIEKFKTYIFNGLKKLFEDRNYLYTDKKKEMFLFIKIPSEDYLDNIIVNLYNYIKTFKDSIITSLGVANSYKSIKNIEQLFNESYLAALFSNQEVIYFNSLDTIKLLYPLKEDKEIQEYYKRTIKKLERYDEEHGSYLIETLEAYFRYNLKKTTVAEKLYIHVETLRYRLSRIEEITGYSLDDSEGLFALQMGIKLKRLIKIN